MTAGSPGGVAELLDEPSADESPCACDEGAAKTGIKMLVTKHVKQRGLVWLRAATKVASSPGGGRPQYSSLSGGPQHPQHSKQEQQVK